MSPPSTQLHLVLLETSGNQNFIFATNKLRENLGASELIGRACSSWIFDAIQQVTDLSLTEADLQTQPSIFENPEQQIEVILAASGKALLLCRSETLAKQIITQSTKTALKKAPGLDLCGVSLPFEPAQTCFSALMGGIHERLAFVRAQRPSPATRFLRLPIVADCAISGLPAAELHPNIGKDSGHSPRSKQSLAKDAAKQDALDRLNKLLKKHEDIPLGSAWTFADDIKALLAGSDGASTPENRWISVIHADGNGLGEIFLKFEDYLDQPSTDPSTKLQAAFQQLRNFSRALDRCTERAFLKALKQTFNPSSEAASHNTLPVVPLILGGDDLTVLCDGRTALPFTASFLQAFEKETGECKVISNLADNAFGVKHLSSCAGIAIVKPKFPFSVAYSLAEDLIRSAKVVKQTIIKSPSSNSTQQVYPSSALDFHILYDSSNVSLSGIRQKFQVDGDDTQLYSKPYVVSERSKPAEISEKSVDWWNQHSWGEFLNAVQALKQGNEKDNGSVPRSQVYGLRQSLFEGKAATDARLQMLLKRYDDRTLKPLLADSEEGRSLFQPVKTPPAQPQPQPQNQAHLTHFLDALEAVDFFPHNFWEQTATTQASEGNPA